MFRDMKKYLTERKAVHMLPKGKQRPSYVRYCDLCCQPGHLTKDCNVRLCCTHYSSQDRPSNHAPRNCPTAAEEMPTPDVFGQGIVIDDGVQRAPLCPTNLEGGKRFQVRGIRKTLSVPAGVRPAISDELRLARQALKALNIVDEDEDYGDYESETTTFE